MKKLTVLFILCLVSLQFETYSYCLPKNDKVYYWFYLKLGKTTDKETKSPKLLIKKLAKEIESGTYNEFIERHRVGLKTGLVVIGPFANKMQAKNAMRYYQSTKKQKAHVLDSVALNEQDTICYYYLTRPVLGKWLKPLKFQRIPSRIASGSQNDYQSTLAEGFLFQFLAIGPFWDYGLAEKSKFIFRKNGEPGSENNVDSMKLLSIKDMSKKWKSVRIEIVRLSWKRNATKVQYRIKIRFPQNYFIEDAFQTITIKAKYSDTSLVSNTGITFQGDYVMDNNEVVPFNKPTIFTQNFTIKKDKNIRLKGFDIESFIFNDAEMVDQDKRFIKEK